MQKAFILGQKEKIFILSLYILGVFKVHISEVVWNELVDFRKLLKLDLCRRREVSDRCSELLQVH